MKSNRILFGLTLSSLLAFGTACDKQDRDAASKSAEEAATKAQQALSTTATEVKEATQKAATEVKQAAEQVTTEVKQAAQNASTAVAGKTDALKAEAQSLIDKAKALINDKKYEEALGSLKQLSNFSLTPEQQKTVDDLKAQLQKLMSSQVVTNAASALGNMFKK